jgi:hypothetical protein
MSKFPLLLYILEPISIINTTIPPYKAANLTNKKEQLTYPGRALPLLSTQKCQDPHKDPKGCA